MKKTIILFTAGLVGTLGLYLYKNKKKKEVVMDNRSLAKRTLDYTVYYEEEIPGSKEELFI